jgi:adenine deaminase
VFAKTAIELAGANNVTLPGHLDANTIYDSAAYEDLGQFLSVYDLIGQLLQSRDDVSRVTYESLTALGADYNVWYREIFISPQSSPLPYGDMLAGVHDGMRDAKQDCGIDSRIIVAINRERSAAEAIDVVQQVIDHRADEVVGVGMDYAEVKGPPTAFTSVFELAHRAGLHCTAHSENGPPQNIEVLPEGTGSVAMSAASFSISSRRSSCTGRSPSRAIAGRRTAAYAVTVLGSARSASR